MLNKKLQNLSESKLSKALVQITENQEIEKTGFIKPSKKEALIKTKSFRFREEDLVNFSKIISCVQNNETRMIYSESQIIRGLVNYVANNVDGNIKKLMPFIKTSS